MMIVEIATIKTRGEETLKDLGITVALLEVCIHGINNHLQYFFSLIFDNDIIRHITEQTFIYAMQKDEKELKYTEN